MKRFLLLLLWSAYTAAAPITVRHPEGLVHGFLTLRTLQGELIANGDLIQNEHAGRVTSRLVFHFKDGSLFDETAVFTQRSTFRLVDDHLVQKGPSFQHAIDMHINGRTGQVEVHYSEDNQEKTATEHVANAADLANGMLLVLLKNLPSGSEETKFTYVVPTPKPRVVTMIASIEDEDEFKTGDEVRKAKLYRVKVDLGGLTGILASFFGKTPPDQQVWIVPGEAPAFVKSEGQLQPNGPVWRIELANPTWKAEK